MNTISDSYRFFLDIQGVGIVQAYPQNSELKWTWKRKKGYRLYQLFLDSKLNFLDIPASGIYDFTKLANLERQGKTCERVPITIDRYCDCDNTWEIGFYKGYLRLSQADMWNFSECRVGLPVVVEDVFTCMTANWDKTINMFDYGSDPIEVTPFQGVIQYMECQGGMIFFQNGNYVGDPPTNYIDDCLDDPETWSLVHHEGCGDIGYNGVGGVVLYTKWAREFVAGGPMPSGVGWVAVAGGWARTVATTPTPPEDVIRLHPCQNYYQFAFNWDIVGVDENGNTGFTNGKYLGDIISDWFLETCGVTFISDFLGINPDNTAPANDYYSRAAVDARFLTLFQVTDVARLDETQSATIGEMTVQELIKTLKFMFNLDLGNSGTSIRMEHHSYFQKSVVMDLTQPQYIDNLYNKHQYNYDEEELPKREFFGWSSPSDNEGGDFDGYPIEYENACVDDREDATEKTYKTSKFLTNVSFVFGNEDYFDSKEILIVSTDGTGLVNFAVQPISGQTRLNGNLAFGYLHPRYHDHTRPFPQGLINKILVPMYSLIRQRKGVPLELKMSCLDYRDNFTPDGLYRTQMGPGEVDTAQWIEPEEVLTLNLKYK